MYTSLKRSLPALVAGSVLAGSFAFAVPAFAAAPAREHRPLPRPDLVGTVESISGSTLTIAARNWRATATTTYTVNAANATVTKDGAASTLSAIAVGDRVMAKGTLSGTTLTATTIRDGLPAKPGERPQAPTFTGNGKPVVGGSVTAISGTTLTVTAKDGTAYAVDAANAAILKAGATTTLASIAQGDTVIVQGTINGSAVTATTVIDQANANAQTAPAEAPHRGFFSSIGGFFAHLFGF